MATVLALRNLSDSTLDIDFVTGNYLDLSNTYRLLEDGLVINLPEIKRTTLGDTLLVEGRRLIDRIYQNREIEINFKISAGQGHELLVAMIRRLVRLIETAKETSRSTFGDKIVLDYKLDNAATTMRFTVIDAELSFANFGSPLLRRKAIMLDCSLKLICYPYATAAEPIRITNYLKNPTFSNPFSGILGDDAGYKINFPTPGTDYLSHATASNFQPPTTSPAIMAVGLWVERDAIAGTIQQLVYCGTTTEAWRITIKADNTVEFVWTDTAVATHTVTSTTALSTANTPYHIGVLIYTTDNSDIVTCIMINGVLEATLAQTGIGMRAAAGAFRVGFGTANGFDGSIKGLWLQSNRTMYPYQMRHIYEYGMRALFQDKDTEVARGGSSVYTEPTLMSREFWGCNADDLDCAYPMDNSGTTAAITDMSGNGRNLTVNGTTSRSTNRRKNVSGWTIGSAITGANEGIFLPDATLKPPVGLAAFRINGSSSANRILTQAIADFRSDSATVIFFVHTESGSINVDVDCGTGSPTPMTFGAAGGWQQVIVTFDSVSDAFTFQIGNTLQGATDFLLCGVQLIPGQPYGNFPAGAGMGIGTYLPYIGSRFLRAMPDADQMPVLDIAQFSGDAPALCRLILKAATQDVGAIKVGASFDTNPYMLTYFLQGNLLVPDRVQSSAFDAATKSITANVAASVLTDRVFAGLPTLFPFPEEQTGSFKLFVGREDGGTNQVDIAKVVSQGRDIYLSGDPVRAPNVAGAGVYHLVDAGLLAWPPQSLVQDISERNVTARQRRPRRFQEPKLVYANIADTAASAKKYRYFFFLPVEDGAFVMTSVKASTDKLGALTKETGELSEALVIDSINQAIPNSGYVAMYDDLIAGGATAQQLIPYMTSDHLLYGTAFQIPPIVQGGFFVVFNQWGSSNNDIFGQFSEGNEIEAELEFVSRYLYI